MEQRQLLDPERDAPILDTSLDTYIVVDGIPAAPKAKLDRLEVVLKKVFKEFNLVDMHLVTDPQTGNGLGSAFLQFRTAAEAHKVCVKMNNYKLDKAHTFTTLPLSKFDEVVETPEQFEPKLPPIEQDNDSVRSWLLEPNACDQYLLYSGKPNTASTVSIFRNRGERRYEIDSREGWTQSDITWSPKGTFLATFHNQGIALWGKSKFERLARLAHQGVRAIDFSPDERFAVTWSIATPTKTVIVWDVAQQKECRSFQLDVKPDEWPVFKWSHDGKYFARQVENAILVYETETFGKLDKKNLVIPDLKDFQWSPASNIISYWTPEEGPRPCRVALVSIPKRENLSSRNMFKIEDCKMYWQQSGEHVCVRVARATKPSKGKKKQEQAPGPDRKVTETKVHDLEIFHVRKKDIPYDHVELNAEVVDVQWEPSGTKFAVLVKANMFRLVAYFYDFIDGKPETIGSVGDLPLNTDISWSPRGEFCVLAPMRQPEAQFKFVRVTSNVEVLQEGVHDNVSETSWDPTGRFFVTTVTNLGANMDFGYKLWWMTGTLIDEQDVREGLWCLKWRPRPASLLTNEDIADIEKDFSKYASQYEEADKIFSEQASEEERQRRDELYAAWHNRLNRHQDRAVRFVELLAGRQGVDDGTETVAVTNEIVIEQTRTPVSE